MKILLILGPKGGAGKTTLARNLAVCAAMSGLRTSVLDTDPQGSLATWWKKRPDDRPAIDLYQEPLGSLNEGPHTLDEADLLVIDTPTAIEAYPGPTKALVMSADLILVPVRPTPEDTHSLVPAMRWVRSLNPRTAFVLSQVAPRVKEATVARRNLAGVGEVAPVDIPALSQVYRTFEHGLGVAEVNASKAGADFEALWRFVADRLALGLGAAA